MKGYSEEERREDLCVVESLCSGEGPSLSPSTRCPAQPNVMLLMALCRINKHANYKKRKKEKQKLILKLSMCMDVLSAYMSMHFMCAWCP